jgi:hypothetical protein
MMSGGCQNRGVAVTLTEANKRAAEGLDKWCGAPFYRGATQGGRA